MNGGRQSLYLIYKKGSRADCGKYRGIDLLSVVGKIYARVVCDRLRLITDAVLMDEQGGFRVRRGCVDQIFAVTQVTEKVIKKDKVLVYAAFVDLEKAYDNVSRSKLWVDLKDYGVKGKLLAAVQSLYDKGWASGRKEVMHFSGSEGSQAGLPTVPMAF